MAWLRDVLLAMFSSALYDLLLATGVGLLVGALKAKKEKWSGPTLYGLAAFALILVIGFALTGQAPLTTSKQLVETIPENIEDRIRAWTDSAHLIIQKRDDSNAIFEYNVGLHGGSPLTIMREKQNDKYIKGEMSFDIIHQDLLEKIPEERSDLIFSEIRLGLAKLRWTYIIVVGSNAKGEPGTLKRIVISKMIPIADLDERNYDQFLDDADFASAVVGETVTLAIAHNRN